MDINYVLMIVYLNFVEIWGFKMSIVLEKNGKYVLKVYSHLNKVVQLTYDKKQAMDFPNEAQDRQMRLQEIQA